MQPADTWPVGEWLAAPAIRTADRETGVEYDVLTGGVGNNTHVYFNRANFTGDGRFLIFRSDRTGSWQLSACDIAGQRLRRLTEVRVDPGRPSIDQQRPLSSFWLATADGARVWKAHEEKRHLQHLLFCPANADNGSLVELVAGRNPTFRPLRAQ